MEPNHSLTSEQEALLKQFSAQTDYVSASVSSSSTANLLMIIFFASSLARPKPFMVADDTITPPHSQILSLSR